MIIGLGTDAVEKTRIEAAYRRHGTRFLGRIFHADERAQIETRKSEDARIAAYARRFAAKEAAAKALGTGFQSAIRLRDIAVLNLDNGQPILSLHGESLKLANSKIPEGYTLKAHVSLSDTDSTAFATVVLEAVAKESYNLFTSLFQRKDI